MTYCEIMYRESRQMQRARERDRDGDGESDADQKPMSFLVENSEYQALLVRWGTLFPTSPSPALEHELQTWPLRSLCQASEKEKNGKAEVATVVRPRPADRGLCPDPTPCLPHRFGRLMFASL